MLRTRLIPVLVLFLMLSVSLPISEFAELPQEASSEYVPGNLEGYDLYLDEVGDSGGDGALTTAEPSGAHKEASILSGVEFRSDDLISDLTIYGEGTETLVRLSIYMQFKGQEGSTADLTFTLNAVGGSTYTETLSLSDPCSDGLFNSDCSWTINEIFFDVPEDGFTVSKGAQLRLQIDGSASCEGQGGIGQGGDCDVLVAYGDVEQTAGYSRVELKANALAESSVKVHTPGGLWTDGEALEWAPNHRPEFRTIQFTVDVRDAFGRADINSVSLLLSTPSGANTVFDKDFEDDDLRLDNNGLVGNYTWTYDAGIAPGQYPLQLEIVDVQGHVVVFTHQGIEFVEHDIYLSLPVNQPDVVLIAPGQVSSAEFMIEHTGSATVDMNVVLELFTTLPGSWSDPVWDQPAGYALNGGGSFARPILSIEAPSGEEDLDAPEHIEVWARAYAENDEGVIEEVQVKKIILDVEEVGVYASPRLGIWEDSEHQIQIADSNRPEAYDPLISHYIDSEEVGEFFIDVFNAGFDTDTYRLKIEDMPDGWQYVFYDNDTGQELATEGIHAITPDIGSHEILTLVMKIYPPTSRDDADIGMVTIRCSSTGDAELNTIASFTIHRTFGILAEVISDSDGGDPGIVGPKPPGSTVSFDVRITDSTQETGQNTWRVISPEKLSKNTDNDEIYGTWTYTLTDDNGSDVVALRMSPGDEVDITVEIEMRDKVIFGNHTIYLRVTEENPDDEPRYFDLPLTIKVSEDVTPGRIFVERVTPLSSFLPNEAKHIEFQVQNDNNVPLDIIITADIIPTGWDARLTTSANQMGGNFVLLTIDPYSKEEFTMILTAPDNIVAGDAIAVTLEVTPMDDEVPYDAQYTQRPSFEFTTDCSGLVCIGNFLTNPTPQTMALYAGLILVVFLAVYRRGQTSVAPGFELEEVLEDELGKDLEDLPEPAISDEELDDDLELLEDLEDL